MSPVIEPALNSGNPSLMGYRVMALTPQKDSFYNRKFTPFNPRLFFFVGIVVGAACAFVAVIGKSLGERVFCMALSAEGFWMAWTWFKTKPHQESRQGDTVAPK